LSVYSTRFGAGLHTGAAATFYVVPAAMTVVIRCVTAYNAGASSDAFELSVNVSGFVIPIWHISGIAGASSSEEFQGRVVINAGEQLNVATGGQPWSYTVSGYLLSP
jgi:hypothetical protein